VKGKPIMLTIYFALRSLLLLFREVFRSYLSTIFQSFTQALENFLVVLTKRPVSFAQGADDHPEAGVVL
jgi:hypothetical protein